MNVRIATIATWVMTAIFALIAKLVILALLERVAQIDILRKQSQYSSTLVFGQASPQIFRHAVALGFPAHQVC